MISVKADNSINMDSFGHIFLRPFCTHKNIDGREEDGSSAHHGSWSPSVSGQTTSSTARSSSLALASERASGLKMQEARLQGYQLEGATLEHLVAARCGEGFSIMSISEDKGSSRGLGMRGESCPSTLELIFIRPCDCGVDCFVLLFFHSQVRQEAFLPRCQHLQS